MRRRANTYTICIADERRWRMDASYNIAFGNKATALLLLKVKGNVDIAACVCAVRTCGLGWAHGNRLRMYSYIISWYTNCLSAAGFDVCLHEPVIRDKRCGRVALRVLAERDDGRETMTRRVRRAEDKVRRSSKRAARRNGGE